MNRRESFKAALACVTTPLLLKPEEMIDPSNLKGRWVIWERMNWWERKGEVEACLLNPTEAEKRWFRRFVDRFYPKSDSTAWSETTGLGAEPSLTIHRTRILPAATKLPLHGYDPNFDVKRQRGEDSGPPCDD